MEDDRLQILVHGENISELIPEISYPGVTVSEVNKVESPNYLFINLRLSRNISPGELEIVFKRKRKPQLTYKYEILERDPGSADREGFSAKDVIYLITPDRFSNGNLDNDSLPRLKEKVNRKNKDGRHGGDLQGVIGHLDYISDMGFTQIWLNPVLENDHPKFSYHGYSTTDYFKIDARFGDNELYRRFSKEAKKKGIGIIKDVIPNHIGSEHWWMKDLPSSDWVNNKGIFKRSSHVHEVIYDPYVTKSQIREMTDGWFVKTMPDLNQRNSFLATYLIQNSIWWIEYADLSGIRVDTYPYAEKEFLSEWSGRIISEYPNFNFVGEEWNMNSSMIAYWQAGSQNNDGYISSIPSMMDFPLQSALVRSLEGEESWNSGIGDVYRVIANDYVYGDPYNLVVFAGNHDMQRIYSQLNNNIDLYKMAMSFILTTRGIPQIYYGTEIIIESTADHGELRKDFPGGWKGDKVNAFSRKGLSNKEIEAQKYLKTLLNWRKKSPAITNGKLIHYPPKDGVYVYFRLFDNESVMVLVNNNKNKTRVDLERFYEVLKNNKNGTSVINNTKYNLKDKISLDKKSVLILEVS
jgi:glycosidase